MTSAPRVLILRSAGTNCDLETGHAFERAGATTGAHHINRLIEKPDMLREFDALAIPGGFSYGDDIGSGKVLAVEIRTRLADALGNFLAAGKLVLGICNGFQVLVKSGLLPWGAEGLGKPNVELPSTLTWNDSRHYECRWVHLGVKGGGGDSPFLAGVERMWLPIAHAEGKFISDDATLDAVESGGHAVLRYIDPDTGDATGEFPHNPNGSFRALAGMSDASGRVFGLMPHPERHLRFTHRPDWTRLRGTDQEKLDGDGFAIFRNAVEHLRG